jgi:hypothetical protein
MGNLLKMTPRSQSGFAQRTQPTGPIPPQVMALAHVSKLHADAMAGAWRAGRASVWQLKMRNHGLKLRDVEAVIRRSINEKIHRLENEVDSLLTQRRAA